MEIIGHAKQRQVLTKMGREGNLPHALLFAGPAKIGKKQVALELAKSLFCEAATPPCENCYSCRKINEMAFPDLSIVSVEPETKEIKIEQIWNLSERLALKSYGNSYKVGIIDDAHLMNASAQNALLKTLEEPKGQSLIILITNFPDMLLATVRSRAQIVKFSLVPKAEIEKHLIKLGAKEDQAKEITILSSGQIGKAIDFFKDPEKMKLFTRTIKEIEHLCHAGYSERFAYAKQLIDSTEDLDEVLEIWERFFRREMLFKETGNKSKLDYSITGLVAIIRGVERLKYLINNTNINKKMALENLLINL
ncbi:MAG: DNA polymerase III subunit delta' [Candidatus Paceibacterota bacterium]